MSEYLHIKDIHKDFSGLKVLTGVDFTVRKRNATPSSAPTGRARRRSSTS